MLLIIVSRLLSATHSRFDPDHNVVVYSSSSRTCRIVGHIGSIEIRKSFLIEIEKGEA